MLTNRKTADSPSHDMRPEARKGRGQIIERCLVYEQKNKPRAERRLRPWFIRIERDQIDGLWLNLGLK
jgi:hypothetical protein